MRNDIKELVKLMLKEETKINYAAIARQYEVDYRTIKRYAEMDEDDIGLLYKNVSGRQIEKIKFYEGAWNVIQ